MGCVCVKENIQLDQKIVNLQEEEPEAQEESKDNSLQFPSITGASVKPNRINSFNKGSLVENSKLINIQNLAELFDFGKSSYLSRFNKKSQKNLINLNSEDKYFDENLLKLINSVRNNPVFLNEKIKEFTKCIKHDNNTYKSFFVVNKSTKINLLKGKEAFLSCCEILENLNQKIKNKILKLDNLETKEELKFPFPEENPNICNKKDYISEKINELGKKVQSKFKIKGFHYDMSPNNAETSLIMQIVDDNSCNGKRRNIIFDDKIKYIGISHRTVKENVYCVYLVFAS
jgi:hypothetical protein